MPERGGTMIGHNDLTIFRNRHRARELREFHALVEDYFLRSARDSDGLPVDWEGAQAARSRIHQMLPRVIQVVRAAGLEGTAAPHLMTTDPGPALGQVDALQRIFSPRYANGGEQELLDILDMALGVYDADQMSALVRSVSPFHYAGVALNWLARAPRRVVRALGLTGGPSRRAVSAEVARLEAIAARLGDIDQLLEARLASLDDRQVPRLAEQGRQLAELAERLDFAERMLAQGGGAARLSPPRRDTHTTPV
jgi:hypothetical protein